MSIVSLYAVFASREEAERIAASVVEERLAACANILGPVHSLYRWAGTIQSAEEVAAIFKTTDKQSSALMARITSQHSYEVPCLVIWPIGNVLGAYANWVEANVG